MSERVTATLRFSTTVFSTTIVTGVLLTSLAIADSSNNSKSIEEKKKNPITLSGSLALFRGFDQDNDIGLAAELSPSYRFENKTTLGTTYSMTHHFTKYLSKKSNFVFEDILVWAAFPEAAKFGRINIAATSGLILPTSEVSRNATLRAAGSGGAAISLDLDTVTLTGSNTTYLYIHEYTTANKEGTLYNEIVGLKNGASAAVQINKRLSAVAGGYVYSGYNYKKNWNSLYSVYAVALIGVSETVSTSLTVKSSDKTISNNSMFDQDNSAAVLGVEIKI